MDVITLHQQMGVQLDNLRAHVATLEEQNARLTQELMAVTLRQMYSLYSVEAPKVTGITINFADGASQKVVPK